MRTVLLLLLGLCLLPGCADGPSLSPTAGMAVPPDYDYPNSDTVQVVTWNLEHFVDGYDNPYIDAEQENQPDTAMTGQVRRATRALRRLDADLVVLQEAESEAFLQSLTEEHLDDLDYRFATSVESPSWYMNVVLLSRYPLGVVRNYADVATPIVDQQTETGEPAAQSLTNHRLWLADVRVAPDRIWTVAGAHLKAGRSAEDRGWRVGQIRFLHAELARLIEDRPTAPILVAGDLNSLPNSPELRLLLNNPDRPAPDSLLAGAPPRRAWFTDPMSDRLTPTHPTVDPARQLDYLLPNTALTHQLVDGSARVARPLPPDSMIATSDHLPVTASFLLPGE